MRTRKTKIYSQFSLNEIKEDLKIASSDNSYNGEIGRQIKSAVHEAEQFTGIDIVPTVNQLEDYNVSCKYYQINQPNITVTGVTADGNSITGFTARYGEQYTVLVFNSSINCTLLNIGYTSGFQTIPPDIMKAITIKIGEYFDADRNGWVSGSMKETKAFQRLLYPHKQLIY